MNTLTSHRVSRLLKHNLPPDLRVSVKLTNYFANRLQTKAVQQVLMLSCFVLVACLTGCASSGTLQPHQAFRQTATPYQAAYYQGQQAGFGQNPYSGAYGGAYGGAAPDGNYGSYAGYNSEPAYGQTNPALTGGQNLPFQPNLQYQANTPAAGFNYQPAYSGGFSSGSC